jgi:hypothetical protein
MAISVGVFSASIVILRLFGDVRPPFTFVGWRLPCLQLIVPAF